MTFTLVTRAAVVGPRADPAFAKSIKQGSLTPPPHSEPKLWKRSPNFHLDPISILEFTGDLSCVPLHPQLHIYPSGPLSWSRLTSPPSSSTDRKTIHFLSQAGPLERLKTLARLSTLAAVFWFCECAKCSLLLGTFTPCFYCLVCFNPVCAQMNPCSSVRSQFQCHFCGKMSPDSLFRWLF